MDLSGLFRAQKWSKNRSWETPGDATGEAPEEAPGEALGEAIEEASEEAQIAVQHSG